MENETARNKIIQRKPIFDHWELPHAPSKVLGGSNAPVVFLNIKKLRLRQHCLFFFIEEETKRNKIIQRKSIFDH
jgi:hypothetical protein